MNKPDVFDLYTDYLITSFSYTTATVLSNLVDNEISHDQITRFLSREDFTPKELWKVMKKAVREIETDEDINLLNCLYYSKEVNLPVVFELVKKPIRFFDIKTQREKRKSEVIKNKQLRDMLKVCCHNQLKWRYALADSWFSSSENMKYIHETLEKYYIFALKSNRLVALTKEDKAKGRYTRIDAIQWSEELVRGWVKGLNFPVLFHRQIFTNKDSNTGTLYLISNDISATKATLEIIYQKRWKVEVFHKSDLHHKCHRIIEQRYPQSTQKEKAFPHGECCKKSCFSCYTRRLLKNGQNWKQALN